MTRALGSTFERFGLRTKIQFPDGVNARTSWRYIQRLEREPDLWRHIGLLSYHLYGPADPYRSWMYGLARRRGVPNAQTEQMGPKSRRLYDDLVKGGVSYWSIYGWGGVLEIGHDGVSVRRGREYWRLRQVMHYVRPGAVRVEARSDVPALRALAFLRGRWAVVVLMNERGTDRRVVIRGLPPGTYGVCLTVFGRPCEERGKQEVGSDGSLRVDVPGGAWLTVYPRPADNLPPVPTVWEAEPALLSVPGGRVALRARATDPDGDGLSYHWSLGRAPTGARVVIDGPTSPSAIATGFDTPGLYVFEVVVSDGKHAVRRRVGVRVLADNQPPHIIDLHNRIPVVVTLPQSSTILRAGAVDPEGKAVRCWWSVERRPAGAEVRLERLPRQRAGTARRAVGLTVPGEYLFRFHASDGRSESSRDLQVVVYPANHPPVFVRAGARYVGGGRAVLSAEARDADGDVITYWWSVRRTPKDARVHIERPGLPTTRLTGALVPGEYLLTVCAIDRAGLSRWEVRLTVPGPSR